ncbi:hypothetical protein P7C70_g2014, partial [Phenoliferia sp. Uapishka_3]
MAAYDSVAKFFEDFGTPVEPASKPIPAPHLHPRPPPPPPKPNATRRARSRSAPETRHVAFLEIISIADVDVENDPPSHLHDCMYSISPPQEQSPWEQSRPPQIEFRKPPLPAASLWTHQGLPAASPSQIRGPRPTSRPTPLSLSPQRRPTQAPRPPRSPSPMPSPSPSPRKHLAAPNHRPSPTSPSYPNPLPNLIRNSLPSPASPTFPREKPYHNRSQSASSAFVEEEEPDLNGLREGWESYLRSVAPLASAQDRHLKAKASRDRLHQHVEEEPDNPFADPVPKARLPPGARY